MNKKQCMQKFKRLLSTARRDIIARAEHLLNSGAVSLSDYDDNYLLPKILLHSILETYTEQTTPLAGKHHQEANNLRYF